jgi:hypothetical protein
MGCVDERPDHLIGDKAYNGEPLDAHKSPRYNANCTTLTQPQETENT